MSVIYPRNESAAFANVMADFLDSSAVKLLSIYMEGWSAFWQGTKRVAAPNGMPGGANRSVSPLTLGQRMTALGTNAGVVFTDAYLLGQVINTKLAMAGAESKAALKRAYPALIETDGVLTVPGTPAGMRTTILQDGTGLVEQSSIVDGAVVWTAVE